MQRVMAATGWHGVGDLSAAHRFEVLVFVLGIIVVAALLAIASPGTDREKDAGVRRTPEHDVRHPNP